MKTVDIFNSVKTKTIHNLSDFFLRISEEVCVRRFFSKKKNTSVLVCSKLPDDARNMTKTRQRSHERRLRNPNKNDSYSGVYKCCMPKHKRVCGVALKNVTDDFKVTKATGLLLLHICSYRTAPACPAFLDFSLKLGMKTLFAQFIHDAAWCFAGSQYGTGQQVQGGEEGLY